MFQLFRCSNRTEFAEARPARLYVAYFTLNNSTRHELMNYIVVESCYDLHNQHVICTATTSSIKSKK